MRVVGRRLDAEHYRIRDFLTRVALLIKSAPDIGWNPSLVAAFGWGMLYDLAAALSGRPLAEAAHA